MKWWMCRVTQAMHYSRWKMKLDVVGGVCCAGCSWRISSSHRFQNLPGNLQKLTGWLKNGVDTDSNMQISVAEFMAYVRSNDRVNQKWLAQADPCVVANGFVHYHFMMPTIQLARELRKKCDGMVNATTCHDRNWVEFKAAFGSGPNYLKSQSECLAFINVDENRH